MSQFKLPSFPAQSGPQFASPDPGMQITEELDIPYERIAKWSKFYAALERDASPALLRSTLNDLSLTIKSNAPDNAVGFKYKPIPDLEFYRMHRDGTHLASVYADVPPDPRDDDVYVARVRVYGYYVDADGRSVER